jgi:hypothetical protein
VGGGGRFQLVPDAQMFGRLLIYLGHLWMELCPAPEPGDRFEIGAVVVNLTGLGKTSHRCEWPEALLFTGIDVRERNLAEEEFAAANLAGIASGTISPAVLPLIPMMQGGADPGNITEWLRLAAVDTDAGRRSDWGGLALVFAEAAGCEEVWKQALKGWNVIASKQVQEWQAQAKTEGKREGKTEGKAESIIELLEFKFQAVPADLASAVLGTTDPALLKRWLLLAHQSNTLEQFRQDMHP